MQLVDNFSSRASVTKGAGAPSLEVAQSDILFFDAAPLNHDWMLAHSLSDFFVGTEMNSRAISERTTHPSKLKWLNEKTS